MSELDSHITIDEKAIVRCKDSEYFIRKPFKIDHTNLAVEGPHKILDGKSITLKTARGLIATSTKPIYESAKRIEKLLSWKKLHTLLEQSGKNQKDGISALNEFFSLRKDFLASEQTVLSLALLRHPLERQKFWIEEGKTVVSVGPLNRFDYERLLDYLHEASKPLVLAPDLRVGSNGAQTLQQYLDFVDYTIQVLSTRNQKPIFAPLQPELPGSEVRAILEHYKSKGYANIWVDLNGGQWDGPHLANVRGMLRWIDELFGHDKSPGLNHVCLYYSHLKKEQDPHRKEDAALSSDVLSQFFCADFIGVNQPRRQGGPSKEREEDRVKKLIEKGEYKNKDEYVAEYRAHHNRVFDPNSYYYYKPDKYPGKLNIDVDLVLKDNVNRLYNSELLRAEIAKTRAMLDKDKKIRPYLRSKRGLTDHTYTMEGLLTDVPLDSKSLTAKLGSI